MPRRPVKNPRKHGFQPGVSGNPAGRKPGSVNKIVIAEKVREAFAQLLDNNVDKLEEWLHALAKKNPEKALDIWVRISERFVPMLSRTEITGKDGEAFAPITINLPAIPKFTVGEGAPAEKPLPLPPGEDIKELPETLPDHSSIPLVSEDNATGEASPFTIPKFTLSPNILRDIEETGGGAPTGRLIQDPYPIPGDGHEQASGNS